MNDNYEEYCNDYEGYIEGQRCERDEAEREQRLIDRLYEKPNKRRTW